MWILRGFHVCCLALLVAVTYALAEDGNCSLPDCLKCNSAGRCIRCVNAILHPSGECVAECAGKVEWNFDDPYYEGVVCYEKARRTYSLNDLLLVVAACCCGAICVAIVLVTIWYSRYRGRTKLDEAVGTEKKMFTKIETTKKAAKEIGAAENCDSSDRQTFLKRLEVLYPETPHFLGMLNETRKLSRLYTESDVQAKAYRAAIRDLLRILTLLSRKDQEMTVPTDWQRLLGWAERVLHRYKRWKLNRDSPDSSPNGTLKRHPREHHDLCFGGVSRTPSPPSSPCPMVSQCPSEPPPPYESLAIHIGTAPNGLVANGLLPPVNECEEEPDAEPDGEPEEITIL